MSGIGLPVSVSDGLSSPFADMTKHVVELTNAYGKFQETVSRPVSYNVNDSIGQATMKQRQFNQSVSEGTGLMGNLVSKAKMLVGAYLGLQAAKQAIDLSDTYSGIQARVGMINDGLQSNHQLNLMIFDAANKTRGSYLDMAQTVTKLGILAKDAFNSNAEMIKFTELMQKSFKVGGAGLQEQKAAMYQLSQAMASGRLQGDEFRSILENAPMLAQAIKRELNGIDLKKASADGLITADVIKRAMFNSARDIEDRFGKMPMTIGEAWNVIKNNFVAGMAPMLEALNRLANNPYIRSFVDNSIIAFGLLGQVAGGIFDGINAGITLIGNNWQWLGPIVYAIVGAVALYGAALAAVAVWHGIVGAAEAVHAGVMILWTVATGQMTFAQWGFNSALLACPITWIIAGVIAVIGIYYALIGAFNHVTGQHVSGIGLICGLFGFMGAMVFNVAKNIINHIGIAAEFVANVFNHPTYSVMRLFVNLGKNALGVCKSMTKSFDSVATNIANAMISGANMAISAINWIIDALNKIPGVDIGKVGKMGYTSSITHSISNLESGLDKWLEASKPKDYKVIAPHLKYTDPMDWANKGYEMGANFSKSLKDKASGLIGKDKYKPEKQPDLSEALKNQGSGISPGGGAGNKAQRATAGNTKKTAENTEKFIDDIRYLREMAERQAINRFTTAEIKIENTIHNPQTQDLDGFVDALDNELTSQLERQVDGYYAV
ncbi:MAG: tape measure protein [Peptostreptococcus sp.]|uniref:tape measure protein n=1 Tax=Peptostreptococcus TaxID=1257 RepID=UPI00189A23F0|nr:MULTISPECIES: tape measure protein [Peptostreptococcus]MDB8851643.1 tape measure protein [Peptostreptococcus anaerobius]MDU5349921.1 tape measure protein [Peptostreptococcus sp.]MDU5890881.1 tape measure protein [Peptostreptococcus sp.]